MAEVFLAIQRGPGGFEKLVAIKQLLPELVEEPGFVEMFLDEARIAAALTHPNICQTFELGQEAGRYFIAMEYLSGASLSRLWKKSLKEGHPLPPSLAAWVVARAAQGLAHAHEATTPDGKPLHIVHRDVSPDNIVVTYDGLVKVVDFGIATAANKLMKTRTGVVKGKLSYMSPEQAQGHELDARADVYSLGAVLYEVLAHQPMIRADNDIETMRRVVAGEKPSLHVTGVPSALAHAVDLATAKLPALRPSAHELATMIDDAIRSLKPLPGSESLARHMEKVFAAERAEEGARLKTAAAQDIEDFLFRTPPKGTFSGFDIEVEERPRTRRLGAGSEAPKRRRWVAAAALGTLLLAGGGVVAWRATRANGPAVSDSGSSGTPRAVVSVAPVKAEPAAPAPSVETPAAEGAPLPEEAPPRAAPTPPRTVPPPKTAHPKTRPHVAAKDENGAAQPVAEPATGKLTFDTVPWTEVFLGTRKLGTTPLVEVELPAGTHQLRLVNHEAQIDRRYEVVIHANQVVTLPRTRL